MYNYFPKVLLYISGLEPPVAFKTISKTEYIEIMFY